MWSKTWSSNSNSSFPVEDEMVSSSPVDWSDDNTDGNEGWMGVKWFRMLPGSCYTNWVRKVVDRLWKDRLSQNGPKTEIDDIPETRLGCGHLMRNEKMHAVHDPQFYVYIISLPPRSTLLTGIKEKGSLSLLPGQHVRNAFREDPFLRNASLSWLSYLPGSG